MVPKSSMAVPTLKQPYTNVANINSIKTFRVSKFPCLQIYVSPKCLCLRNFPVSISGMVVPTLCQRCTSVVVLVYGMPPKGGGWGNVWLKNNAVPTLGQHWDIASIDNHYSTIPRVSIVYMVLLV